jgi:hypothetical protein
MIIFWSFWLQFSSMGEYRESDRREPEGREDGSYAARSDGNTKSIEG